MSTVDTRWIVRSFQAALGGSGDGLAGAAVLDGRSGL